MADTKNIETQSRLDGLKAWFKNLNAKKILSIVLNVFLWIFLLFSILITVLVFSAQGSEDGVPSIFGKSLITISTDSMAPIYNQGDLVFLDKLSSEEIANLEVGQIITFKAPIDLDENGLLDDINTHTIYQVNLDKNEFITKGENSPAPDNQGEKPYTVHFSNVIGKCEPGAKIAGLGNVINFLRSSLGFFLCIVLPLLLFFLYELYNFISIIVSEKAKKVAAGAASIDEEEIKRRAVEEYLAKQKNEEEIKKRAIEEYLAAEAAKKDAENADKGQNEN